MQLPALHVQTGDPTNGLLKAQQMAASQQGIRDSQLRNNLLTQQQRDQQAAGQQQQRLTELASSAAGGDGSAMQRLIGLDPERAKKIVEATGAISADKRAESLRRAEMIGRGANILAGTPQGKRPALYSQLRSGLMQAGVVGEGELPEQYTSDIDQNLMLLGLESDAVGEMLSQTRFEELRDADGNIVGQRNMQTGKVESDPRAPKSPLVTVNSGGEPLSFDEQLELETRKAEATAQAKAMGALHVKDLEKYGELADSAEEQIPMLRVMAELAPQLKSGALGETALQVQKAAERLGIPLDISGDTTKAELFQKLSNSMTLLQRKPGSGEMSDSDRDFFQNTVANLFTSPEGNALAIEFGLRRANRALEMEERYTEWLRGDKAESWPAVRNKYLRENPLFTEVDRAKAEAVSVRASVERPRSPTRFDNMSRDELMRLDLDDIGDDVDALNAYAARLKATRE